MEAGCSCDVNKQVGRRIEKARLVRSFQVSVVFLKRKDTNDADNILCIKMAGVES